MLLDPYCASAEPLPFVADDLLVHFDEERSAATLDLLAEIGKKTQVLLFTHHRRVVELAEEKIREGTAGLLPLAWAGQVLPPRRSLLSPR